MPRTSLLDFPKLALLTISLLSAACATSIDGDIDPNSRADDIVPEESADAGTPIEETPDAAQPLPDAAEIQVQEITLQAGTDNTVNPQNSVSCNSGSPDFFHTDNHYYRTYPLESAGVASDLEVTSVDVGIEQATSLAGSQPIQVSLHTLDGNFVLANLTLLASTSAVVADQSETTLNVPIEATVPAGSTLVVEVFSPDGQANSNRFFIGSNRGTEAFPSFIRAPGGNCVLDEPAQTNALGVDGLIMSLVLNVSGTHTSP